MIVAGLVLNAYEVIQLLLFDSKDNVYIDIFIIIASIINSRCPILYSTDFREVNIRDTWIQLLKDTYPVLPALLSISSSLKSFARMVKQHFFFFMQ